MRLEYEFNGINVETQDAPFSVITIIYLFVLYALLTMQT